MSVSPTQEPYLLAETENQIIFSEEILPDAFDETATAVAPKAFFLGGQSGSGKSGLSVAIQKTFLETERAVIINSDALREYHPAFSTLQKTDVDQASFLVNPDTIKWQQKLISAAVETKRNLILDDTLGGNPSPIMATMQMLRTAGYAVQVSMLAVPAKLSRFGIYKRFEDQLALKSAGRWVGMTNHDRLYDEIPKTLALLEVGKTVDTIQIYARPTGILPPELLYKNVLKDGQWQHPPNAVHVLTECRDRVWTVEEQNAFTTAVQAVAEQMRKRGVSQTDIDNFYRYVECPL